MKRLDKLSNELLVWSKKVEARAIEKHKEAVKKICDDVKMLAPGNGEYMNSIKVGDTKIQNGVVKTAIYTDLMSEGHAVGRMIEHGTGIYALEPHIGTTPGFYNSGFNFWFVPTGKVDHPIGKLYIKRNQQGKVLGRFYVAYAQKPKPHFKPALNSNKNYYKEKIREALKP